MIFPLLAALFIIQSSSCSAAHHALVESVAPIQNVVPHRFENQPFKYPSQLSIGKSYFPTRNADAIKVLSHVSPAHRQEVALSRSLQEAYRNHATHCAKITAVQRTSSETYVWFLSNHSCVQDYCSYYLFPAQDKWGVRKLSGKP